MSRCDEWEQFRAARSRPLKQMTANPVLVGLGDIYPPEKIVRHGFVYESVGGEGRLLAAVMASSPSLACQLET